MIDPHILLKKLRVSSTTPQKALQQSSRISQYKLSKLIYNNRNIRQIGKFIRQANSVLRKSKHKQQSKRVATQQDKKGRYDQNQLKQLSYQFQSVRQKYLVDVQPIVYVANSRNNNNQSRMLNSKRANMRKLTSFNQEKLRRERMQSHGSQLPFINRMKSLSFSSNKTKQRIMSSKQPLSPSKLKNRTSLNNNTTTQPAQTKISLKQYQLQSALNNLIQLVGTQQSKNYNIPRQNIYNLIQKHYKLNHALSLNDNVNFIMSILNPAQNSNSNSHSNTNSNTNQQKQKFHLQLPYCQFINLKQCRKSIDRIFNMPIKVAQRIAFKIYDRNDNGIIDQKDIIELFTIAEQFQAMQQDMQVIIKNFKYNNGNNTSTNNNTGRPRQNTKLNARYLNKNFTNAESSQFSLDKLNRISVIQQFPNQQNTKNFQSQKFRKSMFFTFTETKKQFLKKKKQNTKISLTWQDFQSAFKNTRPQIYYDLLDYLFNIDSLQIYNNAQKSSYQKDKKSYRINIFPNSDGKSQMGENAIEQQLSPLRKQNPNSNLNLNSNSNRKMQKASQRKKQAELCSQQKLSSNNIVENLISKVTSVQQFSNLKLKYM